MDYPELTLSVIDEQVARAAREGRIIAQPYVITPEAAARVLAERVARDDDDDPGKRAGKLRDQLAMSPVLFGLDGLLLDGRHCLTTIAWTGVTGMLLARFGHDPAARLTIDTGKARPS